MPAMVLKLCRSLMTIYGKYSLNKRHLLGPATERTRIEIHVYYSIGGRTGGAWFVMYGAAIIRCGGWIQTREGRTFLEHEPSGWWSAGPQPSLWLWDDFIAAEDAR